MTKYYDYSFEFNRNGRISKFSEIVSRSNISIEDRKEIYFLFLRNVYDLSEKIIRKCGSVWNTAFELDDLVCKGEEILYAMVLEELDSSQTYFKFYTRLKHRLITVALDYTVLCCSDVLYDKFLKLLNAEMRLGEDATVSELAQYMDTEEDVVFDLLRISDNEVVSYDTLDPTLTDDYSEDDIIDKINDEFFVSLIKDINLTPTERFVLSALYGVNLLNYEDNRIKIGRVYTQNEVAKIMNRSNKLVSKIKTDAFSKIKNNFAVSLLKRININDLRRLIDNFIEDEMQKAFLFSYFGIKNFDVLQKYKLYCDGIPKSVLEIYTISGVNLYLVKEYLQKGINQLVGFLLSDTDKEISKFYLR